MLEVFENIFDKLLSFVNFSPKDIANLKNEIEKRQKETDGQVESDTPPAILEDIEKIIEPKPVASNEIEKLPATTVTAPIIQKTEIIAS